MLPPVSRRGSQVSPALKRSSSAIQSSSGFLPPVSMTRTRRPHIPSALTDGISTTTTPTNRLRIASVLLNREDTIRTSRCGVEGDTALPPARPLSASQSLSRLSSAKPTPFSTAYATLGRSWRKSAKTRPALPSELLPSRPHNSPPPTPTHKSAMEQYLDSDGQVLEPLGNVLTSESDMDVLRDAEADSGLGFVNILGDLGTQVEEPAFTQPCVSGSSDVHSPLGRGGQPPILTASPRLGCSANTWGVSGGIPRRGSPRLGSPRLTGSVWQWTAGSLVSPHTSFHRERCSINRCRSARWRGVPLDLVTPEP